MAIEVFVNERNVGSVVPGDATVGDVVEANLVYMDPRHLLQGVEVDGASYRGDTSESYGRLPAAQVARLTLRTESPEAYGQRLLSTVQRALGIVSAKIEVVIDRFDRGEDRSASSLLAELLEELQLALVLDRQVSVLDPSCVALPADELLQIAERLLPAQERQASDQIRHLLSSEIKPLLQRWLLARSTLNQDAGAGNA